jgi:hypothetical protein
MRTTFSRVVLGLGGLVGVVSAPRAAQSNLKATATAPTKVALSWTGSAGANGYWIRAHGIGRGIMNELPQEAARKDLSPAGE